MLERLLDSGLPLAVAVMLGAASCGNPVTNGTWHNPEVKTTAATVKVEGLVSGLAGTCPALTFTLKGAAVVTTTTQTVFENCPCRALRDGMKVQVEGLWQPNGSVTAVEVKYDPK